MIVFGLVFGRWWRSCLVAGALAWPALLLVDDIIGTGDLLPAAALGLVNTAVGVVVHQGVLRIVRYFRHDAMSTASGQPH